MIAQDLGRDLQLAWRGLRRARAFSAAAVLTIALGIAGATVMFALVDGVLLRPLPVHEQDRLIVAWKELRSSGFAHYPFGDIEIDRTARDSRLLERVAGVSTTGAWQSTVVERGEPTQIMVAPVTSQFFDVLRVTPLAGRTFNSDDDVEGAEHVLVLSHRLWQRRYGGSYDVVGVADDTVDPAERRVWRRGPPPSGSGGETPARRQHCAGQQRTGGTDPSTRGRCASE